MDLQVQCVTKTERMEGDNVVADVTLQPYSQPNMGAVANNPMYAQGAQIGTPNAPQPVEQPTVTLGGSFTLQIRDQQEAAKYQVGQKYSINFGEAQQVAQAEAPAQDGTASNGSTRKSGNA